MGDRSPDGMQHLLSRASWDTDGVRDDLRGFVVDRLGDVDAVLVVDETGDLKKGTRTVGVQRQYTGTAGRIENSQVAVFLTYATDAGHAFIDRELYVPASWTADPGRCEQAGIPHGLGFATKPDLARLMLARALDAGVNASWATGDEVYGQSPDLRKDLEGRQVGYVLAVASSHRVGTVLGRVRADQLARRLPSRAWQRYSAGRGAKGQRYYDWALIAVEAGEPGHRWLLVRRNRRTGESAFYRCWSPRPVPLHLLIKIAGRRWTVEECFQTGKGLCGLDQHQVRTWTSWRRWTLMAMLAHAVLAAITAAERTLASSPSLAPLTLAETQRLLHAPPDTCWSTWRRHHQARSRTSHYQRQSTHEP